MLRSYYSKLIDKPRLAFRHIGAGLIIFMGGGCLMLLANKELVPSVQQELLVLAGIIIATAGCIITLPAYLCFLISRFRKFWQGK